MAFREFFLLCILFFSATWCTSQQYPVVRYTPKDGLVNSRVRGAFQDSKGRMYFMTFSGLSIYDGTRFTNYTSQNGLQSDLVNDILEITPDSFLIATNTCGLNALVHGEVRTLVTDKENCPTVNQFLKTAEGRIYASTDDGLFELHGNQLEKYTHVLPGLKEPPIFLGKIFDTGSSIVMTRNELRQHTGLYLVDKKSKKMTDALPDQKISSMLQAPDGTILLTVNDTLFNLDTMALINGKIKLRLPYSEFLLPEHFSAKVMTFDRDKALILSSNKNQIIRYQKDGTFTEIHSQELAPLPILQLFVDRENTIWICDDGSGVYKISNTSLRYDVPFSNLNSTGVGLVSNLSNDSLFMVMGNHQVILHTTVSEQPFTVTPDVKFDILHLYHHDIYAAVRSSLQHATLPKNGDHVLHFKPFLSRPDTVGFSTKSLLDPYGHVLMAEKMHVCVIDADSLLFQFPTPPPDLIEGILPGPHQQVWLVFRSGNTLLCSLHPDDTEHYIKLESKFYKELEGASPRSAIVDRQGVLWIGTRYHGLFAFKYLDGQLIKKYHYQIQEGLTDNFITVLAVDSNQNIIVGTQTGLDKLIKTKTGYRLENVTKRNGIFSFISQIWVTSHNQVFATNNTGHVFEIEPNEETHTSFQPQLILEEIHIQGERLTRISSPLILTYHQNNITFGFAAPTFIDETQVTYSYQLEGEGQSAWSKPTSSADFSFLNLAPGQYHLQVKATFPSTPYEDKIMSYYFQILPAWWQSTGFRFALASLLSILLFLIVRQYYLRKLTMQKILSEKQQAIEKERTRISTDMHDDLGAGLSRIRFLGETIDWKTKSGQTIDEDIAKIKSYSHEMIDKMGEIVWALNEKNDSLEDLLTYIRAYAVDYLTQNEISILVNMAPSIPERFISGEARRNIFLTIKEALHNVVKHARATHVDLQFTIQDNLRIVIRDNGTGFDPHQVRPYSNGLTNMKKRIAEINGQFDIQHDQGTLIRIQIPIHE